MHQSECSIELWCEGVNQGQSPRIVAKMNKYSINRIAYMMSSASADVANANETAWGSRLFTQTFITTVFTFPDIYI